MYIPPTYTLPACLVRLTARKLSTAVTYIVTIAYDLFQWLQKYTLYIYITVFQICIRILPIILQHSTCKFFKFLTTQICQYIRCREIYRVGDHFLRIWCNSLSTMQAASLGVVCTTVWLAALDLLTYCLIIYSNHLRGVRGIIPHDFLSFFLFHLTYHFQLSTLLLIYVYFISSLSLKSNNF